MTQLDDIGEDAQNPATIQLLLYSRRAPRPGRKSSRHTPDVVNGRATWSDMYGDRPNEARRHYHLENLVARLGPNTVGSNVFAAVEPAVQRS